MPSESPLSPAILQMLAVYRCNSAGDYENALKEIIQEIALLGLCRSKFFEHAAFYGGSALSILYQLDRFSEDLDFSLLRPQSDFRFHIHLQAVKAELRSLGFSVQVEEKQKSGQTPIESAFTKAGTKLHLVKFQLPEALVKRIHKDSLMAVKLEIDTDPPGGFTVEARTLLQPIPFSVKSYVQPDLFAGKIHAILQRNWRSRVKGRDFYDFVWYVARSTECNLAHLEQRLRQSGGWSGAEMQPADLLEMLEARFAQLDVEAARQDVLPFLKDAAAVQLWSREFFLSLVGRLRFQV